MFHRNTRNFSRNTLTATSCLARLRGVRSLAEGGGELLFQLSHCDWVVKVTWRRPWNFPVPLKAFFTCEINAGLVEIIANLSHLEKPVVI